MSQAMFSLCVLGRLAHGQRHGSVLGRIYPVVHKKHAIFKLQQLQQRPQHLQPFKYSITTFVIHSLACKTTHK